MSGFGCCRHCVRDSEGACRYLAVGGLSEHPHPCELCRQEEALLKCSKCERKAEVFHPDPNRPGEQIGFCGIHEPEDT